MNKFTWFLIFAWVAVLLTAAYPNFTKANGIICAERKNILTSLENSYGEKTAEQGIDDGLLIVITVNFNGKWSFLMTPRNRLDTFCVAATGTNWTQDKNSSKGVAYNGSIISIIYKDEGEWEMLYLDKITGEIKSIATGYSWQRIIDLNKLNN